MASKSTEEGKVAAILAYITWVGLIIAFVLNMEKKNEFAKFHIRQGLMIVLASIAIGIIWIIPILGWIVGFIGWIVLFVFWIMGLVSAINGTKKEVPLIGKWGQEWFKGL